MKNHLKTAKGASHLLLVLIVATILTTIIMTIQQWTLIETRQVTQAEFTSQAFYAAESIIYQTLKHLKEDSDWPGSFPHDIDEVLGETTIVGQITRDEGTKIIAVDLTATYKKTKRRLVANLDYQLVSGEKTPLDICLNVDRSYSMDDLSDSLGAEEPLTLAKEIALKFVNVLEYAATLDDSEGSKVALQAFSLENSAQPEPLLFLNEAGSYNLDIIQNKINNIIYPVCCNYSKSITKVIIGCWHNIFESSSASCPTCQGHARPEAEKAIIIISDGHVDRARPWQDACPQYACWSSGEICVDDGGGYAPPDPPGTLCQPQGAGNMCTHTAIKEAYLKKNEIPEDFEQDVYKIASLYIPNEPTVGNSACGNPSSSAQLARRTMEEIADQSSSPFFQEITAIDDFDADTLYELLAAKPGVTGDRIITSIGLREELPEPE